MAKVKQPLLSFDARRKLSDDIVFKRQGRTAIVETRPIPEDAKSVSQLSWRHMFQKVVALWHALSAAEKEAWESLGRKRHMTGYAWFVSQALRPNPGIYLPLQGGVMQGIIDMDGFAIQGVLDPVNPQDADTEAARDAAIAAALEDCIDSHIHGWDGSDWQKLLVESNTQHNLRAKLYDGADGIYSAQADASGNLATARGLGVLAFLRAWNGVSNSPLLADDAAHANLRTQPYYHQHRITGIDNSYDNVPTGNYGHISSSFLYGFDGTNWDRLRTYGTGILKVGRAEIGLSTLRRVGAGAVKGSAGTLYWITMNPGAANSVIELTDDLDGSTAVVWDMTHGVNSAHHMNIDPPMEFSTGIWLKTLTNFTSVIFGYK